jgi:hypothetical protein
MTCSHPALSETINFEMITKKVDRRSAKPSKMNFPWIVLDENTKNISFRSLCCYFIVIRCPFKPWIPSSWGKGKNYHRGSNTSFEWQTKPVISPIGLGHSPHVLLPNIFQLVPLGS